VPADGVQVHHEAHAPLGGITRWGRREAQGLDGMEWMALGPRGCFWGPQVPMVAWRGVAGEFWPPFLRIDGSVDALFARLRGTRYEVYGLGLWEAIRDAMYFHVQAGIH
jgi:hypothetical protein